MRRLCGGDIRSLRVVTWFEKHIIEIYRFTCFAHSSDTAAADRISCIDFCLISSRINELLSVMEIAFIAKRIHVVGQVHSPTRQSAMDASTHSHGPPPRPRHCESSPATTLRLSRAQEMSLKHCSLGQLRSSICSSQCLTISRGCQGTLTILNGREWCV